MDAEIFSFVKSYADCILATLLSSVEAMLASRAAVRCVVLDIEVAACSEARLTSPCACICAIASF